MTGNKRQTTTTKTPYTNTFNHSLLSTLYAFRSSRSIRNKYNINVHSISVLIACYYYSVAVNPVFSVNQLSIFYTIYSYYRTKKYLILLDSIGLITQRGLNKYSMTDSGIAAINEISHNSESLIYEFCNKYNLEL